MADLHIDGEVLAHAALKAVGVVSAFESAASDAHDAADHVGHAGLASRVKEFADGWDIRRGKLSHELRDIVAHFEAISDTFSDLDRQTASALRAATSEVAHAVGGVRPGHGASVEQTPVRGPATVRRR